MLKLGISHTTDITIPISTLQLILQNKFYSIVYLPTISSEYIRFDLYIWQRTDYIDCNFDSYDYYILYSFGITVDELSFNHLTSILPRSNIPGIINRWSTYAHIQYRYKLL